MKARKFLLLFLCFVFLLLSVPFTALAQDADDVKVHFIDGENITRWSDTSVVYRNKATTEQNEWGYNIVVNAEGKVTKLIDVGDNMGKNLVIPAGGMVVSCNGKDIDWYKENVSVGDYAYYDKISSRVLFSKTGNFSPYFTVEHPITGFNQPRYSNTFIIYDKQSATTETNGYGYEISVNAEGKVISAGGNNSKIPEGGFVVSAIEAEDRQFLKMYGFVGASVQISADKKSITISYGKENLRDSIAIKVNNLKAELEAAKEKFMLIDYEGILGQLDALSNIDNTDNLTLQQRNELLEKIDNMSYLLCEAPAVEVRAVWHEVIEKTEADVKKVVANLKETGINQFIIGIAGGYDTIIPLPQDFPFKQRANLRGFDILECYIRECREAGIEVVVCVSIFGNKAAEKTTKPEWLTKSNGRLPADVPTATDESDLFFSPANPEFREYIKKYLAYILEHYDIDGLQLDYIRYAGNVGTLDYGYDDLTKKIFAEKYNVDPSVVDEIGQQLSTHSMWKQWCEFKVENVTSLVREIRAIVNEKRPDIFLSAAVASDTRLESYFQDTATWLKEGLLDAVYPMTYGEGIVQDRVKTFTSFAGDNAYVIMGVGTYLGLGDAETFKQTITGRDEADGAAYFEYLSYLSHGSGRFLKETAYKAGALSPMLNAAEAAKAQIDFIVRRINEAVLPNGGIDNAKAQTAVEKLAALKDNLTAENTAAAVSDIEALIAGEKCEAVLKSDLAKLKKIVTLSKDKQKAAYTPADKSKDTSETSAVSEISSESAENTKNGGDTIWLWIALGAVVIAAAVAIFLIIRKKK